MNLKQKNSKNRKIIMLVIIIISAFSSFVIMFSDNSNVSYALSKYGSRGEEVRKIQTKLKRWGYYKGNGQEMFTRIIIQRKNGLKVDGIAGKETLKAMGIMTSSTSSSTSSSNSNDVNLLARLIYGEARGEPYTGQVAVGAVVMNRVKNSSFPNTISGVVYQSGSFDVVSDGQINLSPNSTAKKAAQDALNGWDPSYGAIYYFNPKTATNKWIWSRPVTVVIGNHRFCK